MPSYASAVGQTNAPAHTPLVTKWPAMASSKNAPGSMAITGADEGFQPLQEFSDNVTVRRDALARRCAAGFLASCFVKSLHGALSAGAFAGPRSSKGYVLEQGAVLSQVRPAPRRCSASGRPQLPCSSSLAGGFPPLPGSPRAPVLMHLTQGCASALLWSAGGYGWRSSLEL